MSMLPGLLLFGAFLAADLVTLRNGYVLPADRVFVRDGQIVLVQGGGELVLPPSAVSEVEPLPPSPPPPLNEEPSTVPSVAAPMVRPAATPRELVRAAAVRHGLPPEFVEAVARAESAFEPRAVSPKGALGLMQLMPQTAQALGVDPIDPAQNADGGAKLLRQLLLDYRQHPDQVRRALAAYHAGPGAVKRHNGVPPYRETRDYVERVLRQYRTRQAGGR